MSVVKLIERNCRGLKTPYYTTPQDKNKGIILFLHGCPDTAEVWVKLMDRMYEEGYISFAPFMRGIDISEKPNRKNKFRYSKDSQILDLLELLAEFPKELKVTIVCHDLGSVLGWELARKIKDRLYRLVSINSPDPLTLLKQMRRKSQIKKSWYIAAIQLGRPMEFILRRFQQPLMKRALRLGKYPLVTDEIVNASAKRFMDFIPHYQLAFSDLPKRLKDSGLNVLLKRPNESILKSPLIIWGNKDPFLNIPTANDLSMVCENPEIRVLEGGHWLPIEKIEDISRLLLKS